MSTFDDLRASRIAKLDLLKEAGKEAYPIQSGKTHSNEEALRDFDDLQKEKNVILAGRVMALRAQGGVTFLDIDDGTAKFQILFKKGDIDDRSLEEVQNILDIGDFIEASGTLFLTKRGEKTLSAKNWKMLSKTLRPLPEKWHGLTDTEERFRKRYLDTLMSPEVKARFVVRSQIIAEIRKALEKDGFIEVETPILQPIAGGTNALPFSTHHNALDIDLFLRIAPELFLKRLLIGGFPKVYELGRAFRNEGIDVTHNPEFTILEWYRAYSDAERERAFVEKIVKEIIRKVKGDKKIIYDKETIDFGRKFKVVTFYELLQRYALISNPESINREDLELKAKQLGLKIESGDSREGILDIIYKKTCRPKIIQPTFVIEYPVSALPLAKRLPKNSELVDAFQLVAGGIELVKAFSELNDPLDQRKRFEEQEKRREEGDKEAQQKDEDFLEALEYGMPPAGGVGIGIDRLVMLLTDTHNIREVLFFPTLRPRKE